MISANEAAGAAERGEACAASLQLGCGGSGGSMDGCGGKGLHLKLIRVQSQKQQLIRDSPFISCASGHVFERIT
jgi:hypothetical protein